MNKKIKCTNQKQLTGLLCCAFLVGLPQTAASQIYRWTDQNGKTVVSDTPPPSGAAKKISKGGDSAPVSQPAPPSAKPSLTPDVEKKVRDKEKQEKEADAKRQKAIAEYCESASQRLAQLQSGERISLTDKSGERYFMSDQQRAEEISKMRAGMQEQKCP